ncbi:hypothetical protein M2361_005090 [Achromobacter sp. JUb104]|nr:hypothetical protein [Achromobacter sp. JUb104]
MNYLLKKCEHATLFSASLALTVTVRPATVYGYAVGSYDAPLALSAK